MTYEIIAVENGDVLYRTGDLDEAARGLVGYVEQNRVSRPGIEREVALIEFDEGHRRTGPAVSYEQLKGEELHSPAFAGVVERFRASAFREYLRESRP
jgi:hypothetical protein